MEVVERVENLLVDLRHAAEELDVVEEQAVDAPYPFAERGDRPLGPRLFEARREPFARHVPDLRILRVRLDVVPDRMEEMGLAKSGTRGDQKGIVGFRGGFRDRHRGSVGEAVALSLDEVLERR